MGSVSRWLDVEVGGDDTCHNTLPSDLALVDLNGYNEFKLVEGDLGRGDEGPKLKVFKGAMQVSDVVLPDLPLGVVGFYVSDSVPRSLPVVAVAFSMCVYIYKNMKLFYKYYLPSVEMNTNEMSCWKQLLDPSNHNQESVVALTELLRAVPAKILSNQSRSLLALTLDQQLEYLEQVSEVPVQNVTEITCITVMKLNSIDKFSSSCLVVGTEDGDVIILEPTSFTPMSQAKLSSVRKTPYQMVATGIYTVNYRLTIATREKSVCLLKRDWEEGRVLFNTDEHIISIEVMTTDNSVFVICADNTLACYGKKGKKQWSVKLEHRPVAMTLLPVVHLGMTLVGVALASGHLHLYDGKARRDTIFVRDVVSVMKFGQLGQEEHVLIIFTASGNLMLKILKRTADFSAEAAGAGAGGAGGAGPDATHLKPWLIPKKSKLFLEQSIRERENALAMHQSFQVELNRVRLAAARCLLEAHRTSHNSVGVGALEPVRLSAEVEGLGPVFLVTLGVQNTSADKAVLGLALLFHAHARAYRVTNPYIKVPLLSPGAKLKFPTKIEEIFDENINPDVFFRSVTGRGGEGTQVKVLLLKDGKRTPVLAATVQMPPTDPMMLPYEKIQDTDGFA